VKRALFLLNAVFAIAILDLISQAILPSFVNMLPIYLKDSTFSSFCPREKYNVRSTLRFEPYFFAGFLTKFDISDELKRNQVSHI
jgi:hypothetical protein